MDILNYIKNIQKKLFEFNHNSFPRITSSITFGQSDKLIFSQHSSRSSAYPFFLVYFSSKTQRGFSKKSRLTTLRRFVDLTPFFSNPSTKCILCLTQRNWACFSFDNLHNDLTVHIIGEKSLLFFFFRFNTLSRLIVRRSELVARY